MIIRLRAAMGDPVGSAAALRAAMDANPGNAALLALAAPLTPLTVANWQGLALPRLG